MDTVAADRLKTTFREKDGNRCFYGQCYYCKETELACGKYLKIFTKYYDAIFWPQLVPTSLLTEITIIEADKFPNQYL